MKEYLINSVAPEKRKKHRKALAKLTRPQLGALHDYVRTLVGARKPCADAAPAYATYKPCRLGVLNTQLA